MGSVAPGDGVTGGLIENYRANRARSGWPPGIRTPMLVAVTFPRAAKYGKRSLPMFSLIVRVGILGGLAVLAPLVGELVADAEHADQPGPLTTKPPLQPSTAWLRRGVPPSRAV